MEKIAQKSPPPSLSVSKQRRMALPESQNTVCVFYAIGGGWGGEGVQDGGGLSRTCLKPCFPQCSSQA